MATPSAANRPATLNRTLLALIGLVLVITGAAALAFGLGRLRPVLPALDPSAPLMAQGATVEPWVPWVAVVAGIVVGLLCLRWLLAQGLRRPRTGTWSLHPDAAGGGTTLPADAAGAAVAADIAGYPGVRKATATLTGTREAPLLQLEVTTEVNTPVGVLRDRIGTHALPRLRTALDLDDVPTSLLLRVDAARSAAPRAQ